MANDITNNAFNDKLRAYESVSPSALNPGISAYGSQQQLALSRMQSPDGLLGSIASYFPAAATPAKKTGMRLAPGYRGTIQ